MVWSQSNTKQLGGADAQAGTVIDANRAAGTRLELLLFRVDDTQVFGINVFKVQEVIPYRPLTRLPGAHPLVRGIANLRGVTMPILDLAAGIGKGPTRKPEQCYIVITEYNRSVHGFLVTAVERIVNTGWDRVLPPPKGAGGNSYVTAVTIIDGQMIEILDVEKILDAVVHTSTEVCADLTAQAGDLRHLVLVVDDSSVARNQMQRSLGQIGVECVLVQNGKEALELLQRLVREGVDVRTRFAMLISDIEMPEMDGYQLTTALRSLPQTRDLYILLHSSISGVFNADMVRKTGANRFIQKYHPDDLAAAVLDELQRPR